MSVWASALLLAVSASAETPRLALSLAAAERAALAHSPILRGAESDWASAQAQVEASFARLIPEVSLGGSFQYQTNVPKVSLAPGSPAVQFGDHRVYSVGPTVSYTLWDQGVLRQAWRSQKAVAASQEAQRDLVRRQVRLMARVDYFQVQLALEQERSLLDSLRLASEQYGDIDSRFRAGAASRIDWLSAHQQVLDRRRDLRSAQADVASALRALLALTGQSQDVDLSAPLDARVPAPLAAQVGTPTLLVDVEAPESVERGLEAEAKAPLDANDPQLRVYEEQAESQRRLARSIAAGRWPQIQFTFHSYYFYPNTPLLEGAWQNTAGLGASVPLFEFGRTAQRARAQEAEADSAERRREEAYDELVRDWSKARDALAALRDEEAIDVASVEETAEIARLRYSSYKAGGSTILDVDTADVNAVQARVIAARTRAQALIQLATLASFSTSKDNP